MHGRQAPQHVSLELHAVAAAHAVRPLSQPSGGLHSMQLKSMQCGFWASHLEDCRSC